MKIGIIGGWADEKKLLKTFPEDAIVIAPPGLLEPYGLITRLAAWCVDLDGVVINTKHTPKSIVESMPQDTPVSACFGNDTSVIQQVRRMMAKLERDFEQDDQAHAEAELAKDKPTNTAMAQAFAAAASKPEPVREPVVHRVVREEPVAPEQQQDEPPVTTDSVISVEDAGPLPEVGDTLPTVPAVIEHEPEGIITLTAGAGGRIDWSPLRKASLGQVFKVIKPSGSTPASFCQLVQSSRTNHKVTHGIETQVEFLNGFALVKVDGLKFSKQRAKPGIQASLAQSIADAPSKTMKDLERNSAPVAKPVAEAPPAPAPVAVAPVNDDEAFWRTVFVERLNPGLPLDLAAADADRALELLRQRFRSAA